MMTNHSALAAVVRARREDEALMSALDAAARHLVADAEVQVQGMRAKARRIRREARHNLQEAKAAFEAAGERLQAISALQLEDGVKAAAVRAARSDLSKRRSSLRKVAKALEEAVARAQGLEAQGDEVMSAVQRRPEVAAWQATQGSAGNGRAAPYPARVGFGGSMAVGVAQDHDG